MSRNPVPWTGNRKAFALAKCGKIFAVSFGGQVVRLWNYFAVIMRPNHFFMANSSLGLVDILV